MVHMFRQNSSAVSRSQSFVLLCTANKQYTTLWHSHNVLSSRWRTGGMASREWRLAAIKVVRVLMNTFHCSCYHVSWCLHQRVDLTKTGNPSFIWPKWGCIRKGIRCKILLRDSRRLLVYHWYGRGGVGTTQAWKICACIHTGVENEVDDYKLSTDPYGAWDLPTAKRPKPHTNHTVVSTSYHTTDHTTILYFPIHLIAVPTFYFALKITKFRTAILRIVQTC